jgi:ankyrin repeat protein
LKAVLCILITAALLLAGCDSRKARTRLEEQGIAATDEALFKYAREGDAEKVGLLLRAGCSPNAEEKYSGRTALMYAAEKGHLELVQFLLASKAKVDQAVRPKVYRSGLPLPGWESRTEHPNPGWTALMFAAQAGHCGILRTLLAAGADPNRQGVPNMSKSDNNSTALMLASQKGKIECVDLLLKVGANVNTTNLMGATPLLVAGNAEIAELLLKAGANINAQELYGGNALRHAVARVDERMIRMLLAAGADIHARDQMGRTAMFSARGKAIQVLVDAGADVNVKDNEGRTPLLHVARDGGYRGNVMTFFKAGASLEGLSPWDAFLFLQDAVNASDLTAVKAALEAGATINETRAYGGHILFAAAHRGNMAIVRVLLDRGADPNATHESGTTPLMQAAIRGHTDAIRLLLSRDANINARDKHGHTALSWALKLGRKAAADLLRESGATE